MTSRGRIGRRRLTAMLVLGAAAASFSGASGAQADEFTDATAITVPADGTTTGPADPYPAPLGVFGIGAVTDVNVRLNNYSHTNPNDVSAVVRAPNGTSYLLMHGAGDGTDTSFNQVTFDQAAAQAIPDTGAIVTTSYRPAAYEALPSFPAPGPLTSFVNPGPVSSGTGLLSVFNGSNPNGEWKLFIIDRASPGSGFLPTGWTLDITHTGPVLPSPAQFLEVTPASGSNDNNPRVSGFTEPGDAVTTASLFQTANCTGPAVTASGATLAFPGLQASVADNTTTSFSVRVANAGGNSNCSDSITYSEVTPPTPPSNPTNPVTPVNPVTPAQTKPKCKKPKKKGKGAAAAKGCKKPKKKKK